MALGLGMLVPPLALITGLLVWIWTALVSLYLMVRPGAAITVREQSTPVCSTAAGTS